MNREVGYMDGGGESCTEQCVREGPHRGDEQLQVFGLERVLVVGVQVLKLLQHGGVVDLQA